MLRNTFTGMKYISVFIFAVALAIGVGGQIDNAHARVSLSQLQAQIDALQDQIDAMQPKRSAESWSAERTDSVVFLSGNNYNWTSIPGLTITFTLDRPALVQLLGTGMQYAYGSSGSSSHIGYRFIIDGYGRGDNSWGQRILVNKPGESWWAPWSFSDSIHLDAGEHTIGVQAVGRYGTGNTGICGWGSGTAGYTGCHLNIMAFYPESE